MGFQSKPVTRWKSAKGVRCYTMYYLTFTSSARGFPYTSQPGERAQEQPPPSRCFGRALTKNSNLGSTGILVKSPDCSVSKSLILNDFSSVCLH